MIAILFHFLSGCLYLYLFHSNTDFPIQANHTYQEQGYVVAFFQFDHLEYIPVSLRNILLDLKFDNYLYLQIALIILY